MEPIIEQPSTVSTPVKAIISVTALIASFTAGTTLNSTEITTLKDDNQVKVEQITVLNNEKQTLEDLKAGVTERYIYSQISSGRIPTVDSTMSLNDIQTAYKNIVGTVSLNDHDLFIKGKEEAVKRGDYICK